jgi:hypothetical protein
VLGVSENIQEIIASLLQSGLVLSRGHLHFFVAGITKRNPILEGLPCGREGGTRDDFMYGICWGITHNASAFVHLPYNIIVRIGHTLVPFYRVEINLLKYLISKLYLIVKLTYLILITKDLRYSTGLLLTSHALHPKSNEFREASDCPSMMKNLTAISSMGGVPVGILHRGGLFERSALRSVTPILNSLSGLSTILQVYINQARDSLTRMIIVMGYIISHVRVKVNRQFQILTLDK